MGWCLSSEGPVNYKTKVYASEEIKQMMFLRVTKRGACFDYVFSRIDNGRLIKSLMNFGLPA